MKKISAFFLTMALLITAPQVGAQEAIRDENGIPGSGGKTSGAEYRALLVEDDGTLHVLSALGVGGATEAKQDDQITELQAILAKILAAPSTEAKQDDLNALIVIIDAVLDAIKVDTANISSDQSTETTSAAILAKIIVAPSTEAKQDDLNALIVIIDAVLDAIKLDTANISSDQATETTLAAVLAKIIAAPATEAKQDTGNTSLASIDGKDFSTETTSAAILAKIIAAPATEATVASILAKISADQSTETTSAAILAKLSSDPSTETTVAAILAKLSADPSTETTSAAILAKIIAAPATEAKQDDNITQVTSIELNTDTGTVIDHAKVTVGASATLIAAADTTRRSITIINSFTNLVAIGASDVTLNTADATDGFVLASGNPADAGKGGSITLNTTAAVYGIGASASSKVIYIVEKD